MSERETENQDYHDGEVEKDFFSLLRVPIVKRHLHVQIDQAKEIFKEHIKKYFLENSSKVIPFPNTYSSEYEFELKRINCSDGVFKWKVIAQNDKHLPSETILPLAIIELLAGSSIDAETTNQILNISINGYIYNVFFVKALSDYVVGIVQRLSNELRVLPDNLTVFDTTQFTELPESQKLEVFNWYLQHQPALRKKILFEFFAKILPDSEDLQNLI